MATVISPVFLALLYEWPAVLLRLGVPDAADGDRWCDTATPPEADTASASTLAAEIHSDHRSLEWECV